MYFGGKKLEGLRSRRLLEVTEIFSGVIDGWATAGERLANSEKFIELFEREQIPLNDGVSSLDFVRECVRRSFSVSQVLTFGNPKMSWVTGEQIETISRALVKLGFTLSPRPA
ncbi:MAG: hypothetical protein HYV47_02760 [Candidatus Nealsonbacteria bacterium]|nr:hypothetical protein [Candidatus Nealsonbacteria bacterium]